MPSAPPPVALTIAGSDSSGGAGIQADLKVFQALGIYGATAVTAVTVQNSKGVHRIHPVPADVVSAQIHELFEDIRPSAVKIGMLVSAEIVQAVADSIRLKKAMNIVVDPVMASSSGRELLSDDGVKSLKKVLIPMATVVTPNYAEAERLSGIAISSDKDSEDAGRNILGLGCGAVLLTGGHRKDRPVDLYMDQNGNVRRFEGEFSGPDIHGTGCVFSAAIAANLAHGISLIDAVEQAKLFTARAISWHNTWDDDVRALDFFI